LALGRGALEQARTKAGEDADRLFEEAGRKFAEASGEAQRHEALSKLGNALPAKPRPRRERRLTAVRGGRAQIMPRPSGLKTNYHEALYNWGLRFHPSKTKAGKDADRLFEASRPQVREALRLKPDDTSAQQLGHGASDQAKTKAGWKPTGCSSKRAGSSPRPSS